MPAPLLLHAFPTFAVGGAQARFATVANLLGPRFRHAIVAMDGNTTCRDRLDPALTVAFPDVAIRKGDTLGNVRLLRRVLNELRPARLITHNWGTIEWAMANRLQIVPHIHVEDGFGPEERSRQLPRRVWLRRAFLKGRQVVVPSLTLRRIASEVWRLPVAYVPNGVDLQRFAGPPEPHDGVVAGTVAALRPEKNLARLLRAVARVEDLRLVIAGDGPERDALTSLADTLGIAARVRFAGHLGDPAPLLRSLDIFALSSDTEQMPISLLEGMAAGLPVAATAVGDVASMLPEAQTPFTTPPDDAALAAALTALAADAGLRSNLGAANRARAAAEYGQARMVEAWEALWLGQHPAPRTGVA